MAKDKKGSKAAVAAPQVAKPTEKVKAGRVSKPAETPKAAAKATAKKAAKVVEKESKKSKKAKKEPTPEPSSEEDDTSASSASSDSESEEEVAPPKAAAKTNGTAKAAAPKDDTSEGASDGTSDASSSDSDESEDEVAPPKAAAPKVNGRVNGNAVDDDDSSDASSSDEEIDAKAGAPKVLQESKEDDESSEASSSDEEDEKPAVSANGAAKAEADDTSDASDSGSDSASSDEDDNEEEEKPVVKADEKPSKKRKAETEVEQTPKRSKTQVDGKTPTNNLWIGQLSWNVDEDWLTREFEGFGEIVGVRVITDRDSGRSKGFGYVEFKDLDAAITAYETKNGSELDGRNIRMDFSEPRGAGNARTPQERSSARAEKYGDAPKEPSSTLFVGNISFEADQDMVTELFSEHGEVKGVRLPTDRDTGALKGFGYVEFNSIDEAKAAFEALSGAELAGRTIRLDYAAARAENDSPGGRGGFGGRGGGGFGGRGGGRGGRGGFDRGGRGGGRGRGGFNDRGGRGGGRGGSFNRGGFGDFSGKKISF